MKEFTNRVAVVTGGASGIGYAMAERFAAEAMQLAIADIDQPSLDEAAARLRAAGTPVLAQRVDVADAVQVDAFADRVFAEYGAAHVLCNNAGVGLMPVTTWEASLDSWHWLFGVNLWGVVHGVRSFVPRMLVGGQEGHVVNTASMAGMIAGGAAGGPYAASKHAVVALTETLYTELKMAEALVSASVLCPGWVNTQIMEHSARDAPGDAPGTGAQTAVEVNSLAGAPGVYAPSYVAGEVFNAIRDDRFYILASQEDFTGWMRMRHDRIESGRNPAVPKRRPATDKAERREL